MNAHKASPGPYRSLRAFHREDHHRFFGREEESREVRDLWLAQRVTVLYGASGVGKTSLLQAGVMPLLSSHAADILPLGRVSHGSTFPRAALPSHNPYVLALLMSWTPQTPPNRLAGMSIPAFLRARPAKHDAFGDRLPTLVAIDQVEELFTGGRRQRLHRDWFFGQLAEALRADENLRLLLSIHVDRLMDLLPYEWEFAAADRKSSSDERNPVEIDWERFPLEALSFDGAVAAVQEPLQGTGRVFAEGAAEQVVRDLVKVRTRTSGRQRAQGVEPVQLQVVCEALWRSLPPETIEITLDHVRDHVDTALSEHYDKEIGKIAAERLNGDDRRLRAWLRRTFADRQPVRQSAIRTKEIGRSVIALLVKRHLLRADQRMGEGSYELAYDRLLQPAAPGDPPADPLPARGTPEDFLREAENALREGDLLLAAAFGEEALNRAAAGDLPLRARIESLLGNVAHDHGDLDVAIAHYSSAAMSFETAGAATAVGPLLTAIGRLRLAQGSPAKAVSELRAAMVRAPADLTIQTELAWALWHGGHPEAAVGVLNDVLEREGDNTDALISRGQILAGMGQARAALRDLDRAKPLRWPFAKVAHALAIAQVDSVTQAQQEMVEALAEAAADHDPSIEHGPLLLYAAQVEKLAGKTVSAADLARRAISARAPALPGHLVDHARELVVSAG
ncbi:tetratricopeptide repeat protein [Nonomuraea sp. NPDC049480]|uniref:tetratricopeptide repeat protein n=1 Tax=Nonomuraea sp. NPDC049480 TaxID=3364353 RepID=UPI0037A55446